MKFRMFTSAARVPAGLVVLSGEKEEQICEKEYKQEPKEGTIVGQRAIDRPRLPETVANC